MEIIKGTLVFSPEEVQSIIKRYTSGESIIKIAKDYDVSNPTIGRVLRENKVVVSSKRRNSTEFITPDTKKVCTRCGKELPLSEYNFGNGRYGRACKCRQCDHELHNTDEFRKRRQERRRERRLNEPGYAEKERNKNKRCWLRSKDSFKKHLVTGARARAKKQGVPFNITYKDFDLPEYCPLLGIKLNSHIGEENPIAQGDSPSLDRIIPELGYIKGNVWVISYRANMIKNNASLEELELLVKNLKDHWIH